MPFTIAQSNTLITKPSVSLSHPHIPQPVCKELTVEGFWSFVWAVVRTNIKQTAELNPTLQSSSYSSSLFVWLSKAWSCVSKAFCFRVAQTYGKKVKCIFKVCQIRAWTQVFGEAFYWKNFLPHLCSYSAVIRCIPVY